MTSSGGEVSRVHRLLSGLTIKRKLIGMVMLVSIAVVFLVTALSITLEWHAFRTHLVHELQVMAEMIGDTCASSLSFDDAADANEVLAHLRAKRSIELAVLYRTDGTTLASFDRDAHGGDRDIVFAPAEDSHRFIQGKLVLSKSIRVNDRRLGSLTLQSDQSELWLLVKQRMLIAALLLLLSVALAYALAIPLQRTISRPILELATTAESITSSEDFSLRAGKHADDEVGLLTDSFNQMLAYVEGSSTALRKVNEKYRRLADNLVGTFLYRRDPQAVFTYVSSSVTPMLGYSTEQLLRKFTSLLSDHPSNRRAEELIEQGSRGVQQAPFEVQVRHLDGALRWLEVSEVPVREEGRVGVVEGVAHDITWRKQAEEELATLATVVDQAAEDIIITDTSGLIIYVNPAFERITGYPGDEVIGKKPSILKSGLHEQSFYRDLWQTITSGSVWKGRITNRHRSSALIHEEATISPIKDEGSQLIGYVAVKRDVTEQHEMEEQLRQAQKMEAIGSLAGGIAHDFNNILSAILGWSEILRDEIEAGEEASLSSINEVLQAGERARNLVQQILTFSRSSVQERAPVRIGLVIEEALGLLRSALPATVEISKQIMPGADMALADHTQVHQVVMNLCTNAWQAMRDDGGVLEVKLEPVELGPEPVTIFPDLAPGSFLKLSVRDSGCGIDRTCLDRIFDPYFTTKPEGEGTGMGLAVVHGIVKSFDGAITVESEIGRGTEFCVYLPRLLSTVEEGKKTSAQRPQGNERLLVVDDEEPILKVLTRMLSSLGYTVSAHLSGSDAWQELSSKPRFYDLVITDLSMPGMTGIKLAEKIVGLRPEIPILLISGYSETLTMAQAQAAGVREMIVKPLRFNELASVVRRILDQQG